MKGSICAWEMPFCTFTTPGTRSRAYGLYLLSTMAITAFAETASHMGTGTGIPTRPWGSSGHHRAKIVEATRAMRPEQKEWARAVSCKVHPTPL